MVSNGASSLDIASAQSIVSEALVSTPGRHASEVQEVLQALIERSGPNCAARRGRSCRLRPQYLEGIPCRWRCVGAQQSWRLLSRHAEDSAWQPVILFALSLGGEGFNSALVGHLLNKNKKLAKQARKSLLRKKLDKEALADEKARDFFLVRCRASARRLSADATEYIDGIAESLLPPASMDEAEALAQAGSRILGMRVPRWRIQVGGPSKLVRCVYEHFVFCAE